MNPTRSLLVAIVQNDVTGHRVCEEFEAHDLDSLNGRSIDFDWHLDFTSANPRVEGAYVLKNVFAVGTGMHDKA